MIGSVPCLSIKFVENQFLLRDSPLLFPKRYPLNTQTLSTSNCRKVSVNLHHSLDFLCFFVAEATLELQQPYDAASLPRAAPRAAPRGVFAEAGTPTSPPPLPSTLPPGMSV